MYKNYRDTSSQRSENGKWVYMNGELYHWGIKGMKWGRHLPGTDWWKETTASNGGGILGNIKTAGKALGKYGHMVNLQGRSIKNEAKTKLQQTKAYKYGVAGKLAAENAVNSAKNTASKVSGQLSEFSSKLYESVRNAVRAAQEASSSRGYSIDKDTGISHLDSYAMKQMRDAAQVYMDGKNNKSWSNTINQFIQNAQVGIVKGVNKYLKKFNLDDEVDDFLSKFLGNSEATEKRNRKKNSSFV